MILAQILYGNFQAILQIVYESYDTIFCKLTHTLWNFFPQNTNFFQASAVSTYFW